MWVENPFDSVDIPVAIGVPVRASSRAGYTAIRIRAPACVQLSPKYGRLRDSAAGIAGVGIRSRG